MAEALGSAKWKPGVMGTEDREGKGDGGGAGPTVQDPEASTRTVAFAQRRRNAIGSLCNEVRCDLNCNTSSLAGGLKEDKGKSRGMGQEALMVVHAQDDGDLD